jgi:hypothetical protein
MEYFVIVWNNGCISNQRGYRGWKMETLMVLASCISIKNGGTKGLPWFNF